jgi:hypothetical protein
MNYRWRSVYQILHWRRLTTCALLHNFLLHKHRRLSLCGQWSTSVRVVVNLLVNHPFG